MVGGRLYTSNGEEIKDLRQKSVILSKINSKSLQPIGADNDTVKSSTVVDNQELPNIGETDGTQSGINGAIDTKIGSIDESIDTIENDIVTIKDDIANIDAKAYKIKGSKTVEQINAITDAAQGDVYNISDDGEITEGPDEQPFDVKAGDNVVRVQETTTDPETGAQTTNYFWDKFTSGAIDFSAIEGEVSDNQNLQNALNAKQDVIADINEIRDNARYGLDFHNGTEYFAANADFGYLSPYKYSRYSDGQGGFTGNQQAYIDVENNTVFYAGSGAVAISNAQDTCKIQLNNGYVFFLFKQNNQEFSNLVLSPNEFNFAVPGSSKVYINQNGMYFFDFGNPVLVWDSSKSVFKTGHPNGYQIISGGSSGSQYFFVTTSGGFKPFAAMEGYENVSSMKAQPKTQSQFNSDGNFIVAYTANDQSTYAKIAVHNNIAFQSQYNIDGSDLRATERSTDSTRTYKNSYQTLFYPNQNKMIHYGGLNSNNVPYGDKLYLYSPNGTNVVTLDDTNGLQLNGSPIGGNSEIEFTMPGGFGVQQKMVDAVFVTTFTYNGSNQLMYTISDVALPCGAVVQVSDYTSPISRVLSVPVKCSYDQTSAQHVFTVDITDLSSYAQTEYNLIIYYKKIVQA